MFSDGFWPPNTAMLLFTLLLSIALGLAIPLLCGTGLSARLFWLWPLTAAAAMLVLMLLYALILWICSMFISLSRPLTKAHPLHYRMVLLMEACLMALSNTRIHAEGLDRLPQGKDFLLVSNHRSMVDPLAYMLAMPDRRIGFLAKLSLARVPFLARVMHDCGCLFLDRQNNRAALPIIQQATDYLAQGICCMGVFPEGSRNPADTLLPFKNGVFKIAKNAEAPIVVATVRNTERILKEVFRKRTDVYVQILGVIPAEEVRALSTPDLGEHIRAWMERTLR